MKIIWKIIVVALVILVSFFGIIFAIAQYKISSGISNLQQDRNDDLSFSAKVTLNRNNEINTIKILDAFDEIDFEDSTFTFWINLPEFKLRFYKGETLIDSAKIAIGKHYAPILETHQSMIEYRPFFNPTDNELEKGWKPAPPERTDYPDKPHNPLGRRRIVIWNLFRMHGTSYLKSLGRAASNGCTRVDNLPIERITDYIIANSEVKNKYGRKGGNEIFVLQNHFRIIQTYRLWNKIYVVDSTLYFTAYSDKHRRLNLENPCSTIPIRHETKGAGFVKSHLYGDLVKLNIIDTNSIKLNDKNFISFWQSFSNKIRTNNKTDTTLSIVIPNNLFKKTQANTNFAIHQEHFMKIISQEIITENMYIRKRSFQHPHHYNVNRL